MWQTPVEMVRFEKKHIWKLDIHKQILVEGLLALYWPYTIVKFSEQNQQTLQKRYLMLQYSRKITELSTVQRVSWIPLCCCSYLNHHILWENIEN